MKWYHVTLVIGLIMVGTAIILPSQAYLLISGWAIAILALISFIFGDR